MNLVGQLPGTSYNQDTECRQCWPTWLTPLIPAIGKQRQEDFCSEFRAILACVVSELQDSQGYIERLSLKEKNKFKFGEG